jgi:hypothetical protein
MTELDFVLGRDQRDDILKAVKAIEHQLTVMPGKPRWQALWVIGMNLTIIQTKLTGLTRARSN